MPYDQINQLKKQNIAITRVGNSVNYSVGSNKNWVDLRAMDSLLWDAFILNEDHKFWEHSGLNYKQIRISITDYLFKGKRLRGASTITQQVGKNLYLDNSRSWIRKLKEALIARRLERELSKHRILEIYINIVEFGPDVYGLHSASNYYFEKDSELLTIPEGIYLANLLPNPKVYG